MNLAFDEITALIGDRFGTFDVPCPICGPTKRSALSQRRKVLRIWRNEEGFATFKCARCDDGGYAREIGGNNPPISGAAQRQKVESDSSFSAGKQMGKARWLWSRRQPLTGSLAERYLRETRGYASEIPATIGFLASSGDHSACMISALSVPLEIEPGIIVPTDIKAVHLTKLSPDGRKAGTESDKIVVGSPRGAPIALAAINDGLGLVIAEGIEDALSVHEATGLGAWAAGSAPLLPYLADLVPSFVEVVTLVVDDDKAGRRKSDDLASRLESRGFEVRLFYPARSIAA